jgi:hypothetical protein
MVHRAASVEVGRALCGMARVYTRRSFYSSRNQNAKVLKNATGSGGGKAVVFSSKAGACRSLISDRNADRKVEDI